MDQHFVNRKLDFLVKELKVAVAGIQETKWFGQDVWDADGYTLLHSGHTLLGDGEPLLKNTGVGIVLDQRATAAWKNAGECWEVVSYQIVTAWLQIAQPEHGRRGGSRTSGRYLSLLSVYAPTAKELLQVLKQSLLMIFNVLWIPFLLQMLWWY